MGTGGEVGSGNRDQPFDTRSEPDNADTAESLLVGNAEAEQCEAIEGMRRISDLNLL